MGQRFEHSTVHPPLTEHPLSGQEDVIIIRDVVVVSPLWVWPRYTSVPGRGVLRSLGEGLSEKMTQSG